MLPPAPGTKRAKRTKWAYNDQGILMYGTNKNLVMRDLNNLKNTQIFNTQIADPVTCAAFLIGDRIGYGTQKGGVQIIKWNSEKKVYDSVYKSDSVIGGAVEDLALTGKYPNEMLVVVGQGARATCINIQSGSVKGELQMGHTKPLLTVAIAGEGKTTQCLTCGEDLQIHSYRGQPNFKYEKSLQKFFTGFCNKLIFLDGIHFMVASADKTLKIFNGETLELVAALEAVHKMSIIDLIQVSPGLVATTSSDQRILTHKYDLEAKTIETVDEFSLQAEYAARISDKADKQQLAVASFNGHLFSNSNISDINVWKADTPGEVIDVMRGHKNTITAMAVAGNFLITGDIEGRVLYWNLETGMAQMPNGLQKFDFEVQEIFFAGHDNFYALGGDKMLCQYTNKNFESQELFQNGDSSSIEKKAITMTGNGDNIMCYLTQDAELCVYSTDNKEHIKTVSLAEQGANDVAVVGDTFYVTDNAGGAYTLKLPDMVVQPMEGVKTEYGNKGTKIAVGANDRMVIGDDKGFITVFEAGAKIAYWATGRKALRKVGFTDDGEYVYSLGNDRQLSLGDLNDKKTLRKLVAPSDYAQPMCAELIGNRQFAIGGDDGAIRIWKY